LAITRPRMQQRLPSANGNNGPKPSARQHRQGGFGVKPSLSRARRQKPTCGGVESTAPCPRHFAFTALVGMGQPRNGIQRLSLRCKARAFLLCIEPTCARRARLERRFNSVGGRQMNHSTKEALAHNGRRSQESFCCPSNQRHCHQGNLAHNWKIASTHAFLAEAIASAGLCCTNRLRDSSRESSVVAGMHEQTDTHDLQNQELASLQ
jgi:hypothetical protein